jgi:spectinomycin phosphotransferase
MARGMAPPQWVAYGAILRQIHTTTIAADLALLMRRETFVPVGAASVCAVEAHIGERNFADPAEQDLATIWRERRDAIHTLVARAEELGRRLARREPPFVLCHADIHTNNVMLDGDGRIVELAFAADAGQG